MRKCRHVPQHVCPCSGQAAEELKEPAFAAREVLAGKDVRAPARDVPQLTQEEFSGVFKGSPMERAKLRGLKRNATVGLGDVGTADDVAVRTRALDDEEPLVREHAACAIARIVAR